MNILTRELYLPESFQGKSLGGLRQILESLSFSIVDSIGSHQKNNYLPSLLSKHRHEDLTIVLGAGASAERGILTWNTLLQELLLETIQSDSDETDEQSRVLAWAFQSIFNPNPLIAARYLAKFYSKKSSQENQFAFLEKVRKTLYRGLRPQRHNGLLANVRQLCMAVGKSPNIRSVITYNFDDLLEEELLNNGQGIKFNPIFEPGKHPKTDELPIYHVHGYLPKLGPITKANQVVFGEDFYHEQYGDVYRWSNLVQINAFSESSCLFVGISLTDPNQRRLLDIAKRLRGDDAIHHYCIKRRFKPEEVEKSLEWELQKQPELRTAKIDAQLKESDTIRHLIRIFENFEEEDAASFGVGIIWVNSFEDYPRVLEKLRTGDSTPMPGVPIDLVVSHRKRKARRSRRKSKS